MATDVQVPALGESITEGTLAQWLKKPGETVAADEAIASLETDKVSVEVPSPIAGVLAEQLVKEGDTVAVGAVIARIDEGGTATVAAAPAQASAEAATNPAGAGETPALRGDSTAPVAEAEHDDHITTLSPAVRRAVLEYHVDPSKIRGSGKDGRLTKDDVIAAAEGRAPAQPHIPAQTPQAKAPSAPAPAPAAQARPAAPEGERREERVRMSRMRQTIARRLKESQNTAAILTTFNDVDMTAVIEARTRYKDLFEKKHGIRLGFMAFFVKACALAAKDVPAVNAVIDGEEIVYRDYLDVSVAVSAPKGLVVPVVRNADQLSFAEIEKTIADFGKRAKEGTLTVETYRVAGALTITRAATTEREIAALADPLTIDLSEVNRMDTVGAWLIYRAVRDRGAKVIGASRDEVSLVRQVGEFDVPAKVHPEETPSFFRVLGEIGEWIADSGTTLLGLLDFFGATLIGFFNVFKRPKRFRVNAVVQRFDVVGVRALGIIGLMSFLIGIVIAQQGSVQLAQFGAEIYTINLIGRITVRELGTLMTAIMVAGRSGSAFAAQLGTMKITEEIDAMRTIGVSPIEALVIPRIIAAVVMMPLLAFWSMLLALIGGGMFVWLSLSIPPLTYIQRLQEVIPITDMWVGLIKAPVFGFIIALAGCFQGMLVQGNSEEVGLKTTTAVVQSIFLVIVLDAVFAVFFSSIGWV